MSGSIARALTAAALVALTSAPALAQQPATGAEAAAFERATTHDELMSFLGEVQARSSRVQLVELTRTNEGRVLPLVILGNPAPGRPGTAQLSGRPTVFITGNVHGNERAGREGFLQLIRELALGHLRPLLERVNVLVAPTLNPDGAERPSRTNTLGYDMNRDFMAMETPEITAVLEDVLTQWWPDIYVDVHNGGAYPYNVTYQPTLHPDAHVTPRTIRRRCGTWCWLHAPRRWPGRGPLPSISRSGPIPSGRASGSFHAARAASAVSRSWYRGGTARCTCPRRRVSSRGPTHSTAAWTGWPTTSGATPLTWSSSGQRSRCRWNSTA